MKKFLIFGIMLLPIIQIKAADNTAALLGISSETLSRIYDIAGVTSDMSKEQIAGVYEQYKQASPEAIQEAMNTLTTMGVIPAGMNITTFKQQIHNAYIILLNK